MSFVARGRWWSPYLVGDLIGVLSWTAFYVVNKIIGISMQIAGAAEACAIPILGSDSVQANTYWSIKARPQWDWGMPFLVGTFVDAAARALISRRQHL